MFKKLSNNRLSRSQSAQRQPAAKDNELMADILAGREKQSKDDIFRSEPKTGEYGDNQFWKAPEMYDIDELLAEQENGA